MPNERKKADKPVKKDDDASLTKAADDSLTAGAGQTSDDSDNLPVYDEDIRDLVDDGNRDDRKTKRPVHVRVSARQGESVDQMLRRFNFAVTRTEVIQKLKDSQYFEKPSKRRQREEKLRIQQIRRYEK